ncbi:MAG: vWA domain-containing protein [Candidatus Aquicultor sp.]
MSRLEESIEIANPQHPHCATVLLLDTSGSMVVNGKIKQLNDGLRFFKEDVTSDELASKRVDLAIITFGDGVTVAHDFSSMEDFNPPALHASGLTPMGEAILRAIDLIEERKFEYKSRGIDYYRPWIFLITDGEPTDMKPGDATWNKVIAGINDGENNKNFLFFTVGVEPADMDVLKQLSPSNREPVRLMPGKFKAMFEWLSKSQGRVSASKVGENVQLDSPAGWAEISTI